MVPLPLLHIDVSKNTDNPSRKSENNEEQDIAEL
jgi:hypothetical protein